MYVCVYVSGSLFLSAMHIYGVQYYHFLVTFQGEEEAELRRVGLQINADCEDLVEKWTELKKFTQDWSRVLDDAHGKMEQMSNAVAECQLALSNLEGTMEKLTPVEQVRA